MRQRQKGISTVSVIGIVVLVLAIAGGVGYFLLNKSRLDQQPVIENEEPGCALQKYNLDCDITAFLEKEMDYSSADATRDSKNFCAYEVLGEKDNQIYIKLLCKEFYLSDKEIVCPNSETLNECFLNKQCGDCETKTIAPNIVLATGTGTHARITREETGFTLWLPGSGSAYGKDLAAVFPPEILQKQTTIDLNMILVERAQEYFNAKVKFNIDKTFETSCQKIADCGVVPGEFAMQSHCPHEMNCINNKCVVGCYDFTDHQEMPILETNN
ncbi:MAG: hypothetical protein WC520_00160 [Candidatus Paceibacterota bacterium]